MLRPSIDAPPRRWGVVPVLALVAGVVFAGASSAGLGLVGTFEQRSTSVRTTGGAASPTTTYAAARRDSPTTTATVVSSRTETTAIPPSAGMTATSPPPSGSTTTGVSRPSAPIPPPVEAVGPRPPPAPKACPQAPGGWVAPGPGLYELSADGSGAARRILDDALDAQAISISPDGRTLSVVSAVRNFNGVEGPFQLYLVDRNGTNLRRILADLDNPFAAQWSPDGRWIAFLNNEPETYTTGLYVTTNQAPVPGVRVVRLSDGGVTTVFGGDLVGLSWSPDGTRLVGTMTPMGVVVMSASAEGGTMIEQRASSARWSPRTDEIATGFRVLAPDGRFLREMGLQRPLGWSPDGRRVIGHDVWGATVIVEERCGSALVAADGFRTGYVAWSPGGATVLVYSRSP